MLSECHSEPSPSLEHDFLVGLGILRSRSKVTNSGQREIWLNLPCGDASHPELKIVNDSAVEAFFSGVGRQMPWQHRRRSAAIQPRYEKVKVAPLLRGPFDQELKIVDYSAGDGFFREDSHQ